MSINISTIHKVSCLYSNISETCTKDSGCKNLIECESHVVNVRPHCFAVWKQDDSRDLISAGCIEPHNHINETCGEDKCFGKPRDKKLYYCCCHHNWCNNHYSLNTTMTTTTESTIIALPHEKIVPPDHSGSIVPIVIIIALLILLITTSYKFYFKRRKYSDRSEPDVRMNSNLGVNHLDMLNHTTNIDMSNNEHPEPNYIDLNKVKLLEEVGSGRFGKVYKAEFESDARNRKDRLNGHVKFYYPSINNNLDDQEEMLNDASEQQIIAVKIISLQEHQSWLNERRIYSLPNLKHPNILNYIYSDAHLETNDYWLLVEYAPNGSLYGYLQDRSVTWSEFLRIALGIVQGLSHLHDADIAHRDFKSKNVLLKSGLIPCITDFGVAAILNTSYGYQVDHKKKYLQVGTPRYMAPEVLECSVTFTKTSFTKIDVYALSLVLWELLWRCSEQPGCDIGAATSQVRPYKAPFEDECAGEQPNVMTMRRLVVDEHKRPPMLDEWRIPLVSEFCRTIEDGWEYDYDARISASCFVERVEMLVQQDKLRQQAQRHSS